MCAVKNGMLSRNPRLAARISVWCGGQKRAWCMYFTRFCMCAIVCTLLIWCSGGGSSVGVHGGHCCGGLCRGLIGRCHSCVIGSRCPSRTMMLFFAIVHLVASYETVYPASQNLRVEMSDEWERPGTTCAEVTVAGSHGMSRLQVCVDCSVAPSGSVIVMGFVSTLRLMTGAPCTMKWLVAPESLMACCSWPLGVVLAAMWALWWVVLLLSSSSSSVSSSASIAKEL